MTSAGCENPGGHRALNLPGSVEGREEFGIGRLAERECGEKSAAARSNPGYEVRPQGGINDNRGCRLDRWFTGAGRGCSFLIIH